MKQLHDNRNALFKNYAWGETYLQESSQFNFPPAYHPFEEFRMRPYRSTLFNIDDSGFRVTPGNHAKADFIVMVLGGSAVAGSANPDFTTIPPFLQKRFNRSFPNRKVNVLNRGVAGATTSQSIFYLLQELKMGNVPDLVILYTGFNDIARSVQNLRADTTFFHKELTDFYEGGPALTNLVAKRRQWPGSKLGHAVLNYLRNRFPKRSIAFIPLVETPFYDSNQNTYLGYLLLSDEERDRLAREVYRSLEGNFKLIRTLGRVYGFDVIVAFQPVYYPPYNPKRLTPLEFSALRMEPSSYVDLTRRVLPYILKNKQILFFHSVFEDMPKTIFFDAVHLLPEGNERMANVLYPYILGSQKWQTWFVRQGRPK